ncbi:MAG: imidazole glycerol phosphate synthase subunit HisH [Bacillota bacterium]|nr:MAG: imidazole glycerol phosphate synthase subunit HisH [Bacillota bacterium]
MIDYGTGNVHSLGKALERAGCAVRLTRDPRQLAAAAGLVLPGVGAFGPAWRRLEETGLADSIRALVAEGRPILGVCLGMQLLAEGSEEDGDWPGLGFLPGRASRFTGVPKVPHMGWNRIRPQPGMRLLAGVEAGSFAYFVHSYRIPWPAGDGRGPAADPAAAPPAPGSGDDVKVALADYGGPFVAAVERGNVFGTQFHPEKSGAAGLRILRNFGAICGACDPGH